ncbi:hypothetical protein OAK52_02725 [Chloroflexi bacterium]|jgi:hypothetical protein|nr:hypothetical protein [Chloroflexota bacterium]|tara:strand:- start:19330 stop:19485 length:156 start_codon:yes stop_codon:yes gene_type:complete
MKQKRKSLEIKNYSVVYKNQFGEKIDREAWLKISEEDSYIIKDISDQRKIG